MKFWAALCSSLLMVAVLPSVSLIHLALLLNPFWFRKSALDAFYRHRWLKYFSIFSMWV